MGRKSTSRFKLTAEIFSPNNFCHIIIIVLTMIIPHLPTQDPEEERITIKPTRLQRDGSINASSLGTPQLGNLNLAWFWSGLMMLRLGSLQISPIRKSQGCYHQKLVKAFHGGESTLKEIGEGFGGGWRRREGKVTVAELRNLSSETGSLGNLRRPVWRFVGSSLDSVPRDGWVQGSPCSKETTGRQEISGKREICGS